MGKEVTRRGFLKGMAAAGAVALTAGVAPKAFGQAPAKGGFNWKKFAGAKIRFMNNTHDWSTELIPKALPEFEKLTGIKVQWEVLAENQFRQKLTLELSSNPDSVDGFMSLPSWDGMAFYQSGWYEPVEKFLKSPDLTSPDFDFKDFFPSCTQIATIKNTLVGVPLYPEVQMLYYPKEKFQEKKLKVPETFEEFAATAEKLYDKNTKYAGYVSRGDGIQAVYTLAPFVFGMGGRWLDENGRPDLTSDAFVKALELYSGTLHKYGPPGIAGQTWAQNQVVFMQGNAGMNTDSSNFISTYEDPKRSKLAGKVGYAPVPRGPAGLRSSLIAWCLSIGSRSKNKEATWMFIQWLASKEMVLRQAKMKLPVGRESAWKSPEFQSSMSKEWLDAFTKELPTAAVNQANPLVVQVPETRDAIGKAIVSVIQGGNAKEAAMKAQQDCLKILKMT
ncbi:MAG TPA: sugar ABC transporter substrate-binding protein [Thermodesulfobacteriota bacterium]|nr:sugar ABC transporter substrate-binding protein [Thermodesulfobacteriota bacterium]